jgi:ATP synthase protein I
MTDSDADNGEKRDDHHAPTDRALKERLNRLGEQIKKARGEADDPSSDSGGGRGSAMGAAFKLATEMVAGVVVGGGMGHFADKYAGTSPFLLIVFLMLGGAAGIINAVRVAKDMQKAVEKDRRDKTSS